MRNLLVKLAIWIFNRYEIQVLPLPDAVMLMLNRTRQLCAGVADRPQAGEWKRHQVYARLLKDYPNLLHRDAALAIEIAVREL